MADDWVAEWERVPSARAEGGTYLPNVPFRFTVHTTEAIPSTVDGARSMATRHPYPPHVWAWPDKDWVGQTVRLDRSAFALKHLSGTTETNKMRALQVEVIARAADSPSHSDAWWEWIGRRVLRPIVAAGYNIDLDFHARVAGPEGSGSNGAVRLTPEAWRRFDGICGHANVPANSHWDPGLARYDLIARGARVPSPTPTPPPDLEDDDMALLVGPDGDPATYFSQGKLLTHVKNQKDQAEIAKAAGIPNDVARLSPEGWTAYKRGRTIYT